MTKENDPETLTVLYDGACPLCRREIAYVKGLAKKRSDSGLCFLDISQRVECTHQFSKDQAALLERFHVQRSDGSRIDGAAAFIAMWSRLPGWRWLARLVSLPGMLTLLEAAYRGFLKARPSLQGIARRLEKSET